MNDKPLTAKEYLSQAYRIDQRINAKLEQVEQLRTLTRKATASYGGERVTHSRIVSAMEDTIAFIQSLKHTKGVWAGNRLVFVFRDGHEEERVWEDPTRRDSWNAEMRRQAADNTRKRRER